MMLQCCYCSKSFKYESEKKRHEISHIPQFQCTECHKKFSFLSALRRHKKQHDRKGTVQCNECGHYFRDNTLLNRHMKYAHKGTYNCSKCKSKFNSDLALKSHMKTHKPISQRRYKCTYDGCQKSFNFQHHLKHHELIHTNLRHHHCDLCGKGFVQAQHLKTHMRTHENWLHCTVKGCHRKFRTDEARKRHHAVTHISVKIDSGISSDSHCDISQDSVEVKIDSGIFSDSHCDILQDSSEGTIVLCDTCGETIPKSGYAKHIIECLPQPKTEEPIKAKLAFEPNNNYNNIEVFSNCKTVLGKCIANENSPNSCLCAQINDASDFYDALLPNEDFDPNPEEKLFIEKNIFANNVCEGCDCSSVNNIQSNNFTEILPQKPKVDSSNTNSNYRNNFCKDFVPIKPNDDRPKLELGKDGTIKLSDTCDISFELKDNKVNKIDEIFNNNFVPHNSCKDVLGKCIVTGSGRISENCLCAKMAMDDHEMTQEIEEITPQPKQM